jgi:hypothetical protein
MSKRFWLFRNYVDGVPQFLAFDNPYPCHPDGDPMTLGAPYGVAFFVDSDTGREWSDQQVMNEIRAAQKAGIQARDLKLRELVEALPHKPGCPSELCAKCCQHIDGHEFADFDHPFAPMTCKCARGQALALLEATT